MPCRPISPIFCHNAAASHEEYNFTGKFAFENNAKERLTGLPGSPAGQVSAYFQTHPIVGPKLKGLSWPQLKVAKIMLENFPVEQMPPFAKEKFIGGMKEKLKNLPERLNLSLCDAASGKELLRVEVGGGQ